MKFDKVQATGSIEYRTERGVLEGDLRDRATSWTGKAAVELRPKSNLSTSADIGYRVKRLRKRFGRTANKTESRLPCGGRAGTVR